MSEQQVARILSYQNCMRQQLWFNATPNAEDMQNCLRNSLRPTVELLSELARPNITCLHPKIFNRVYTYIQCILMVNYIMPHTFMRMMSSPDITEQRAQLSWWCFISMSCHVALSCCSFGIDLVIDATSRGRIRYDCNHLFVNQSQGCARITLFNPLAWI